MEIPIVVSKSRKFGESEADRLEEVKFRSPVF